MEDLGSVAGGFAGGVASAAGINDAGDIVGQSDAPSGWSAVLFSNTEGIVDLNTRIPLADRGGRHMQAGLAINNTGQLLVGYDGANGYGAVRLTPVEHVPRPVIASVEVDRPLLSPPNGLMVSVSVQPVVTDVYDPDPNCRITAVVNTDHLFGGVDRDVHITGPLTVSLRATSRGEGLGRFYFIAVSCTNDFGKSASSAAIVHVPHDR